MGLMLLVPGRVEARCAILAATLVLGAACTNSRDERAAHAQEAARAAPPAGGTMIEELSKSIADMAERAKPAIVYVSVSKKPSEDAAASQLRERFPLPPGMEDFFDFFFNQPPGSRAPRGRSAPPEGGGEPRLQGIGSGFFIDVAKGRIVTNNHVVEGADEIHVKLANGVEAEAKVIGRDPNTDLAVVEVTAKSLRKAGLGELRFSESKSVRIGDLALALGAPFGLEASLSLGVVSAVGRGSLGITKVGDFLQTDAAINPGNSGGPLIGADGSVIGVNTAIYSQSGAYAGVGFAVPAAMARLVTDRLVKNGKIERGYLGVSLQPLDSDLRRHFALPEDKGGAVVASVEAGGPADKADIEAGDVIVTVNDDAISDPDHIVNAIALMEPGQKVKLGLWRDGKQESVTVLLAAWPSDVGTGKPGEPREGREQGLGLSLAPISPELRERFGFESEAGVVITAVAVGSAAQKAGLMAGDVIVSINRKAVKAPEDAKRLLQEGGGTVLLRVERRGGYAFVPLRRGPEGEAGTSH